MIYMLDTDICIYAINRKDQALLDRIRVCSQEDALCMSAVTFGELEYGAYKSSKVSANLKALAGFAAIFKVLPFGQRAAVEFGKVRSFLEKQGTPIGPFDTMIAAPALAEGAVLVTNNTREFSRVPGLKLENWTAI